ncbi:MAG TPA: hypothetical protein VGQ32_07795 [Thermoanaerobaculia bacterium]|jgi:hypothetical protein|nr:hypothetical protein [Thermoanaerobaculia bacterium]
MRAKVTRRALFAAGLLAAALPLLAQAKKAQSKSSSPSASAAETAAPPKIAVVIDSLMDRRSTGDFPSPSLTVNLKLDGEDAGKVASARPRATRAVDDTGKSLIPDPSQKGTMMGSDNWQQARESGPPALRLELSSPPRKARELASLEGVVETYLPSRDPASTVKVEGVLAKKDKPPVASPALAAQHIRIQVLSKAGLEKQKKAAEDKKKAEAAKKKKKSGQKEGMEGMAEAMVEGMADALGGMFERLFMTAGDNDLILKVDDPGKKLFGFDLASRDGKPIRTYGTMEMESYRIVRIFEPIPEGAILLVRLKTPRSFAETPFALSNVKLP